MTSLLPLKIAIFGAGSIGCYLGGQLAQAGAKVTFIGRQKFKTALEENGLTLTHFAREDIMISPSGFTFSLNPEDIAQAQIILVAVKSQDTDEAAQVIKVHANPGAIIISFQNGVSNADALRKHLTEQIVLGGVVPFNVTGTGAGRFHCGTEGDLTVEVTDDPRLERLVTDFAKAKQGLDISNDIAAVQWGKLLVNLNNALNALSGGTLRAALVQRDYRLALAAMIDEALGIVRGAGIEPDDFGKTSADKMTKILRLPNFLYKIIMNMIVKIDANARSSMLDDLEMGRVSEIDYLQGEIVRLATRTGQSAPINQAVLDMVNAAFKTGASPKLSGAELYQAIK